MSALVSGRKWKVTVQQVQMYVSSAGVLIAGKWVVTVSFIPLGGKHLLNCDL